MKPLPKPTDANGLPLVPGDVYDLCLTKMTDTGLHNRLVAIRAQIVQGAVDYDARAATCDLHQFAASTSVGSITKKEMVKIYNQRFAAAAGPGRAVYYRIRKSSPNDRCPLCEIGTANTLDHYLPKAKYPLFALTPHNLYPACTWCQGARSSKAITSKETQAFHPYFDNFDDAIWLTAEVQQSAPAVFKFGVSKPASWNDLKFERAKWHFKDFNLQELLATNSANQLTGIRNRLQNLLNDCGIAGVRAHLLEEESSWRDSNMNSWEAAFYAASASSNWFCNGGFAAV